MIDKVHFRTEIVRPTLKESGYWSQSAENLLMGTALTESSLTYLKQIKGPAIGFYQCEPETYGDVLSYIKRDPEKVSVILDVCGFSYLPTIDALQWNLRYATMICRMHYWRIEEPLPDSKNFADLAKYHKIYYNSMKGDTDISESINIFKSACEENQL